MTSCANSAPPLRARAASEAQRRAAEREERRRAKSASFRALAPRFIAGRGGGWKTAKTAGLWKASLERWARPLSEGPLRDITRADVLDAVAGVWAARPATAPKVLRRTNAVLRFAQAIGLRAPWVDLTARSLQEAGLRALPAGGTYPHGPWQRGRRFGARWRTSLGLARSPFAF
ncbi:MAG: hypothetical protein RML45_08055 [Acetobacteraceae bacterium]|nr:hypothetical protein [Acetobacteraceae bacterium]